MTAGDLAAVNGGVLHYESAGSGPAVVLVHGGLLDLRQWDEQFPLLAETHQVVRYDMRGFGRSPIGSVPYAHHEDLRALLDHLGLERVHLVSLSSGMATALDFTLAYPTRVRSLAIGAAPLRGYAVGDEFTSGMRAIYDAALAGDKELLRERVWGFAPMRVASKLPAARAKLDRMIVEEHQYAYVREDAPKRTFLDPPAATRLAEIRVPTVVIVGEGEMPALAEKGEYVARAIPGARHVVIPGAGHFVNIEQPEAYTRVVTDWLREQAMVRSPG
jgi:pimeloyl-ACP methyl ester carboxylesterase